MTYDSTDKYVLLFGAPILPSINAPSETWIYEKGNWSQLTIHGSPTSCLSSGLADDPSDGYVVYLAGTLQADQSACPSAGQTWEFKAGVWTQLTPATSPAPRFGASFSDDSADHYLVLFGGISSSCATIGNVCSDTWTFSAGSWTLLTPTVSPGGRSAGGITYDAKDGYVLLFGGEGANGTTYSMLNDTWTFSNGNWTQLFPAQTPPEPDPDGLAYDYGDGFALYTQVCGNLSNDYRSEVTWKFEAGDWSELNGSCGFLPTRPPPQRLGEGTTYDGADGYFLFFGGGGIYFGPGNSCCNLNRNDTWGYSAGIWTDRTAGSLSFLPRYDPSVTYDAADHQVLLFGGSNSSGALNGTWAYSNQTWTLLHPGSAPTPRGDAGLVYDAADGYVLLFGGTTGTINFGDTWEYLAGQWTLITPRVSPSPRIGGGMVYDAADGYVVLFGGNSYPDTWSYRAGVWTNITASAGRPAGYGYLTNPLAYDGTDGYVLLFETSVPYAPCCTYVTNETWSFRAGTWSNLTGSIRVTPPIRLQASMAGMGPGGGVVLFGGWCPSCAQPNGFSDTWEFTGGAWTQSPTQTSPWPRFGASFVYDSGAGLGILFGGRNVSIFSTFDDLWYWESGVGPSPFVSAVYASPSVVDEGIATTISPVVEGGTPPLTYAYNGLPAGCGTADVTALSCTPALGSAGTYTISVTVTDSLGNHSSASTTLQVNRRPMIGSFTAVPQSVRVGQRTVLMVTTMGGISPFNYVYSGLPPGCATQTVPALPCTPSAAGTYSIGVGVIDSLGVNASAQLTLSVVPWTTGGLTINSFTAEPPILALGGRTFLNVSATPAGGGALTFLYNALPTGCVTENRSSLECAPTGAGSFLPSVIVSDTVGDSASIGTLLTVYLPLSGPLSIWAFGAAPPRITLGETTTFYVVATGGNGPLTYGYAGFPYGCFASNLSTLPCTPSIAGQFTVAIAVTDASGQNVTVSTNLSVVPQAEQTASSVLPPALSLALVALAGAVVGGTLVFIGLRRSRPPNARP